jgi:hypothetical protein
MDNDWSCDLENVLEQIRLNATLLHSHHRKRFIVLQSYLKWFRIPTIVFSAIGVFASVGLTPYLEQGFVSLTTCGLSLITGIINSIELFIGVQKGMELELSSSKDFYILATDIFKVLSLAPNNRMCSGKAFLDEKYQTYCKLIETSNLLNSKMKDRLAPLEVTSSSRTPSIQTSSDGGSDIDQPHV